MLKLVMDFQNKKLTLICPILKLIFDLYGIATINPNYTISTKSFYYD